MEKESFSQPEVKEQDISEGTDGLTQFKGQLKRFSWRVKTGLCAPPPLLLLSLSSLKITPGIQQEEPQPSNQDDPQNRISWNEKLLK